MSLLDNPLFSIHKIHYNFLKAFKNVKILAQFVLIMIEYNQLIPIYFQHGDEIDMFKLIYMFNSFLISHIATNIGI